VADFFAFDATLYEVFSSIMLNVLCFYVNAKTDCRQECSLWYWFLA